MNGLPWRLAVGVLGVLLLKAATLQAQTVSAPPPSLPPAPSVIGREVLESDPAAPRRPKPDIAVPGGAGLAVPPELANKEVLFSDIQVEGMTAFNAGALQPLFGPVLNRRVPFSEVVAAVNRVTALYEQGGYVFYSVMLPQQDLDSGKLRIIVVEGSISAVDFGDGIKSEKLRAHIRELIAPLIGRKPLRRADLERRLLLSADLPGVAIQASAKPDAAGGDKVVLVVNGTYERFSPIAQIDSFQTIPDVSVNFRVGGVGRSLLFGGDALELRYLSALPWNRLQMFDARYGVPIGDNGGRLSLLGQAVWQRPLTLINGQAVDFLGRSFLGRVQYSHPFVRGLKWTMMGMAMLDVIDVDYTFLGIGIPGDSLRVARTGLFGAYTDDLGGFWTGTVLGSVGLPVAGAEANGRFGASPSFAKINLSIERVQPFWTNFSALIRASAQMTTGTVPASEVFAYGGRDYGRAFTVAESVGDRGAAVLAELRYNPDWIPIPKKYLDPQFYAFADHGWLSSVSPLNPPYFPEGTSVGAGLRARIWEQWSGEVELAKVVSTPNVGDRPMRASVRFGSRF
jgi:hemolysin activation/secretion protein